MPETVQPATMTSKADLPFISVVIPVRSEFAGLNLLLPELISQQYPAARWEIIVADGGSTDEKPDETPCLIRRFAATAPMPITLVPNRGIRSSAGRNAGLAVAKGELIIFIDGHCRAPSRTLLSDTVTIFTESEADCLCRPQPLSGARDCPMSGYIAEVRRSTFGHGRGSMIYDLSFSGFVDPRSSGASYRRSVFTQVGVYDEIFDACEDVELNARVALAGLRAYSDPRLAIEYQARTSLAALGKQMMRYGRGRLRLARKHEGERSLSSLAPMLLCLSFLALLPAALLIGRSSLLLLILGAPALLYVAAVMAATVQLVVSTRRPQLAWALAIYPVIHLGLGMGMIVEAVSVFRRGPLRWAGRQRAA